MTEVQRHFVALVRSGLTQTPPADPGLGPEDWTALLRLAEAHKLLPLVLHAAWDLPSLTKVPDRNHWRGRVMEQVSHQAFQENEFLDFMRALETKGFAPVVMKGPVCRSLYPMPLLRPSLDDDLFYPAEDIEALHRAMLEQGLVLDEPELLAQGGYELAYYRPNSYLFVEVHRSLFDQKDPVFRDFNDFFRDAFRRSVPVQIQDVTLRTLAPADHLRFLLLHAYKHFLFSGFGLRIVADICLYARAFGAEAELPALAEVCRALGCGQFAGAVFQIGETWLGIPRPEGLDLPTVDPEPLLADILDAGIHGDQVDRIHSANITLRTVSAQKLGQTGKTGALRSTFFLPAKRLSGRYPYLKRMPWLLPLAWTSRGLSYLASRKRFGPQSPAATLRIGRERVKLLTFYGILDEK